MNKIFGSSARSDHDDGRIGTPVSASRESTEQTPDETTRLLPNRIDHGVNNGVNNGPNYGYLSPDDPAVSPYNLFSVRATRYLTILLLLLTGLWWVLVLIAHFVTPPGFQTRGSPFFSFGYSSVSLTSLVVSLLFFAAPSKLVRVITAGITFLLLINTILITAVTRTRLEEGWVGIASVVCM